MSIKRKNISVCSFDPGTTILFLFIVICLTACGGGGAGQSAGDETAAIVFSIELHKDTKLSGSPISKAATIDCAGNDISTIQAAVYDANGALLANGGPWACTAGSGSITGKMAGSNRKIVITADNGAVTIYRGEEELTLEMEAIQRPRMSRRP